MKKLAIILILFIAACVMFSCGKTDADDSGVKPGNTVQSNSGSNDENELDTTETERLEEQLLKNGDLLFSSKYMIEEFTGESFIVSNKTGNLKGVIGTDGEIIIPVEYDDVDYKYSDEGEPYYMVQYEGEKTLLDPKGTEVCAFSGDVDQIVANHIIISKKDGECLMNLNGKILADYRSGRYVAHHSFPSDAAESGTLSYFTVEDESTAVNEFFTCYYIIDSDTGALIDTSECRGRCVDLCERYAIVSYSRGTSDTKTESAYYKTESAYYLFDIITGDATYFSNTEVPEYPYITEDDVFDVLVIGYHFLNENEYLTGESDKLYFAAHVSINLTDTIWFNLHSFKDGVVTFILRGIDDIDQYRSTANVDEGAVEIDGCDFYNGLLNDKEVKIIAYGENNVLYESKGSVKLADMKTGEAVAESRYNDVNDRSIDGYILETFEGEYYVVNKNVEIVARPGEFEISDFDYRKCTIKVNGKNVKTNDNETSYSESKISFTFSIDDYMIVAIPSDSEENLLDFVILNGKSWK